VGDSPEGLAESSNDLTNPKMMEKRAIKSAYWKSIDDICQIEREKKVIFAFIHADINQN
jgi:hypothetical protein